MAVSIPPGPVQAGLLPMKNIPSLVIGVQTDVLFPCWQQKEVADILKVLPICDRGSG